LDLVDSSTITYCTFNGTITGPTHGIMDSVSSEAYSFNSNTFLNVTVSPQCWIVSFR
jgi:hypothetical protein